MTTTKDPQALRDTLDAAAEAIRTADRLTFPGTAPGLEFPGDAYAAIGSLLEMAQRLPQLADQISAWLEAEQKAGRVAHDAGGSAPQSVTSAGAYLSGARDCFEMAAGRLASAQNEASHLKAAGA